ncbi:MAG: ATP-dependent DNA helicase [Betaproteobacteria bacterium]|nr:ATP-dependent DNA helicase [Betaproteobacteria bacterium]
MLDLEEVFAPTGPLAKGLPDYRPRQAQTAMALAVGQALQARSALIVEAGTGTGKTFAYLVPALLSGARVVLSTGTKTLQDQLFLRDIPVLRNLLKIPVTVALLKGRANYLCHHYLETTLRQGELFDRQEVSHLQDIRAFSERTATGDIAELGEVPETATVWKKVTSTRENCLGQACDHHADCFVMKARKQALQADLVVVNHHLFFADMAIKDEGVGELLPRADAVIFDEAHQLPQIATHFFGENLSTATLQASVETMQSLLATAALSRQDFGAQSQPLLDSLKGLRASCPAEPGRWTFARVHEFAGFSAAWGTFVERLENWIGWVEAQASASEEIAGVAAGLQQGWQVVQRWQEDPMAGQVRWLETFSQTVHINATPLLLGDCLGPIWKDAGRSWVFTSATLSVRGDFRHYQENLGLPEAQCHSWESPFDFAQQALLFVPDSLPLPAQKDHILRLLEQAHALLRASQGRAFLLFTSHRALQDAARILETWRRQGDWTFPLLIQGQRSRGDLLTRFRQLKDPVLLGTASFWEGVDIKGEALSVVIIDKLPFAPPDDPVEAARIEEIKRAGRNGFMEYQLPRAILQLKQGAGRLIRDEQDRGVLMIGDRRILEKPYGQQIWQSLPPMARTRDLSVACDFFSGSVNH